MDLQTLLPYLCALILTVSCQSVDFDVTPIDRLITKSINKHFFQSQKTLPRGVIVKVDKKRNNTIILAREEGDGNIAKYHLDPKLGVVRDNVTTQSLLDNAEKVAETHRQREREREAVRLRLEQERLEARKRLEERQKAYAALQRQIAAHYKQRGTQVGRRKRREVPWEILRCATKIHAFGCG